MSSHQQDPKQVTIAKEKAPIIRVWKKKKQIQNFFDTRLGDYI